MARFLLRSSFCSTTRPLASSDAMAYYRPERDQRPCDNGYKSVFTISWPVRQRNSPWIKGLGKNQQKEWNSFIVCSAFCPGPPNRDPMDSEKQLRVYMSVRTMARHVWHVDKAPGHPRRNRNACLKVLRLSMGKMFVCSYGIRCELVEGKCKWLVCGSIISLFVKVYNIYRLNCMCYTWHITRCFPRIPLYTM